MPEEENQMGLFEIAGAAADQSIREPKLKPPSPATPTPQPTVTPARRNSFPPWPP